MAVELTTRPPGPPAAGGPDRDGPLRPSLDRRRTVALVTVTAFLVATLWAWRRVDVSFGALFSGIGDITNLLGRMLPPTFDDVSTAIDLTLETLWMAVIGTTIGVVLSVPLAFGAARNTAPNAAVMAACRGVITLARAIPDVVFALVFVRGLGIGVLPGVLALGLHSIGMVGKLFADAIEQVDEQPREAVLSTGGTKWQAIVTAVVPQVTPSFIAVVLYRLDINLRSSTVLGFVGAGGVGFLLQAKLRGLDYDGALGVVIVVFVCVTLLELLSALMRASLIGTTRTVGHRTAPPASVGAWLARRLAPRRTRTAPRTAPRSLRPPWVGERRRQTLFAGIFAALLIVSFMSIDLDPLELAQAMPDLWHTVQRMFPPDYTTARSGIVEGMVESIATGIVATALGTVLALPMGLLAARNVAANRVVYAVARLWLVVLRGIPELIVAVIFVAAMGLGPLPGALALVVGTTGFFAKLIADAVEEVDQAPRDAVFATGATRLQETFTSVVPQAVPALIGNLLYVLDVNVRASTILGIVGGGGIGFLLQNSTRVFQLQTTCAIIISIFVVVYALELLAGWIRKQLL